MAWGRIDDAVTFHEKIVDAGNAAVGTWVRLISWCSQHLTDGRVPDKVARLVAGESRGALKALVRSGLLVERPGGYEIHDYLDYNPSRAEVLEKREKDRERKAATSTRKSGGPAAASKPPDPDPDPDPIPSLDHDDQEDLISTTQDLEQRGTSRGLRPLNGRDLPSVSEALPCTVDEFERAMRITTESAATPGWKYWASCVVRARRVAEKLTKPTYSTEPFVFGPTEPEPGEII